MRELIDERVLEAVVPWLIPDLFFGVVLVLARRWLSPRSRIVADWTAFLVVVLGFAVWAYFKTIQPWTRLSQALAAAEVYAFSLGLVWAGVALWRRGKSSIGWGWRLGAVVVWVMTPPAFVITSLAFFCMNDRYSCL